TVSATDAALQQPLRFQLVDDLADIGTVDAHHQREVPLVDAGEIIDEREGMVAQGCGDFLVGQGLCQGGAADLLEPPGQHERNAMRNYGVARQHELRPRILRREAGDLIAVLIVRSDAIRILTNGARGAHGCSGRSCHGMAPPEFAVTFGRHETRVVSMAKETWAPARRTVSVRTSVSSP